MRRKLSLRVRIITALVMLLVPTTVLFFACYGGAVGKIEQEFTQVNRNALLVYHTQLADEISAAESFLLEFQNEPEEAVERADAFIARYRDVSNVLLTDLAGQVWLHRFKSVNQTDEQADVVEKGVWGMLLESEYPLGWFVHEIGGRKYWARVIRWENGYAVGLMDLEQLVRNAELYYGVTGEVVLLRDNVPLVGVGKLRERNIEFQRTDCYFSGDMKRYMVVQMPLVGLTLALVIPFQAEVYSFAWLGILYLLFLVAALLTVSFVMLYLRKYVLHPTKILTDAMQEVGNGVIDVRVGALDTPEFEKIRLSFNDMLDEITKLKIEKYEQEIRVEKARMEALSLQIRPHFYQNCLKGIYSMVAQENRQEVQNVILELSNHLRYVFDIEESGVPLKEELRLCENYVRLQGRIGSGSPQLELAVDSNLMEFQVPPVSFLTMLENSFKFGKTMQGELEIRITARILEIDGRHIVNLVFQDNGRGFSEEQLLQFNAGQFPSGHVGMENMLKRFSLLYGERFESGFSNERGAKVDLMVMVQG